MKSLTRIIMRILLVSALLLHLSATLQVIHAQGLIRNGGKIINVVKRICVKVGNDAAIDKVLKNAGTQERAALFLIAEVPGKLEHDALCFTARVPGTPSWVFDINRYTLGTPEYLTVYGESEMVTSSSASFVFSVGGGNGGRWTGSSSHSTFSGSCRPSSDATSNSPIYMLVKDILDSLSSDRQSYNPPVPIAPPSFHYSPAGIEVTSLTKPIAPPSFHYSPARRMKLFIPSVFPQICVATQPCRGLEITRLEMPEFLPIPETSLKLK